MIWLLLPHSLPPFARPVIHRKTKKERQLAHGRGVGEEPNHTTARKLGPLWIIQYSLRWWFHLDVCTSTTVYMIHISRVGMCMHIKNISTCCYTVQCIRLCMKYHILKGIYTVVINILTRADCSSHCRIQLRKVNPQVHCVKNCIWKRVSYSHASYIYVEHMTSQFITRNLARWTKNIRFFGSLYITFQTF